MGPQKEQLVAFWIAAVFLVVGVVCYAAFPEKIPEQPIRIMLKSTAGNILFDHKEHFSEEEGYGLACEDCHHNMEDEEEEATSCGECHEPDAEDMVKRSEAFHMHVKAVTRTTAQALLTVLNVTYFSSKFQESGSVRNC